MFGVLSFSLSYFSIKTDRTFPQLFLIPAGLALFIPGIKKIVWGNKYALVISTSSGEQKVLEGRRYDQLEIIRHLLANAVVSARENEILNRTSSGAVKTCPRCAEAIKVNAVICRFCGHDFETKKTSAPSTSSTTSSVAGQAAEPGVEDKLRDLQILLYKDLITKAEYEEHRSTLLSENFKAPT